MSKFPSAELVMRMNSSQVGVQLVNIYEILGDLEFVANICRKYTQPSQYKYAKLQYRYAVTSVSPSKIASFHPILIIRLLYSVNARK